MRKPVLSITLFAILSAPAVLFAAGPKPDLAAAATKYFSQKSGLFLERKWGKWERSNSGLFNANCIKIHPGGEVYVVSSAGGGGDEDFAYHRAQRFTEKGRYLGWFGGWKSGFQQPGWIAMPTSVSFAPNGDVHLLAALGGYVKTYTSQGAFKSEFSGFGGSGGPTTFPYAVCGDKGGYIYVSLSSMTDGFINKFDAAGAVLNVIDKESMGKNNGFSNGPRGLAADRLGNLYVCDGYNNRVVKFDPDGAILAQFKTSPASAMKYPDEAAISPDGTLYVLADSKVFRFDSKGRLISVYGGKGSGTNQFRNALSLGCAPDGRVYVLDSDANARIASIKVLRPALYNHAYAKMQLAGKVIGMSAEGLKLAAVVVEGRDASGVQFFATARPASDGAFSFTNFPKGAAYRLSLRGIDTSVYLEAADLTGKAPGNVVNLDFVIVAK